MVFYFHTTYARADLKYLVNLYPNYALYDGRPIRGKDVLIIAVYLNLTALAEFINMMVLLKKDIKSYGTLYKERFRYIDLNIDNDAGKPNYIYKNGKIFRGDTGSRKYIYHRELAPLFNRNNSKLLLYNSWETRDLYRCIPVIIHYCKYHNIPTHKLLLSITDHQHMFKKFPRPRIISYDWQYIHAKMNFSRNKIVSQDLPKPKHLVCFNSRSNDERLAAVAYLYSHHREKCHLSFLNNKRSESITGNMLNLMRDFVTTNQFKSFKNIIPLSLDKGLNDCIVEAHVLLIFETNIVRAGCQQISEKTYRPIIAGIPFLLWGHQPGILQHLHKLGFKTFAPFINEEYDNAKYSYKDRYGRLINEVNRICSLGTDEIELLYRRCLPMVEYNFTVLESRENTPPLL